LEIVNYQNPAVYKCLPVFQAKLLAGVALVRILVISDLLPEAILAGVF